MFKFEQRSDAEVQPHQQRHQAGIRRPVQKGDHRDGREEHRWRDDARRQKRDDEPAVDAVRDVVVDDDAAAASPHVTHSHLGGEARQKSQIFYQFGQVLQGGRHRRQRGKVSNVWEASGAPDKDHVQPGALIGKSEPHWAKQCDQILRFVWAWRAKQCDQILRFEWAWLCQTVWTDFEIILMFLATSFLK